MCEVRVGAIGAGVYYSIVLVQENLVGEMVETPCALGLWVTHGEAQDAADKLNARAQ